jgi:hypothetical protein
MPEPLSETFFRNAIASGAIVPPPGEGRRSTTTRGLAVAGWCLAVLGALALAVAYAVNWL